MHWGAWAGTRERIESTIVAIVAYENTQFRV